MQPCARAPLGDLVRCEVGQVSWLEAVGLAFPGITPVACSDDVPRTCARTSYSGGAAPDLHRLP